MSPKHKHQRPFDEELVSELLRERLEKDDPTPQFRDSLYGRLMRQQMTRKMVIVPSGWNTGIFGWMSSVAIACFVLLVGSGLTTAYAYVSPNVTRQSSLYTLKLIVERAELSFSSSPEDQARSLLKFSKRRTSELRTLSLHGELDTETLAAIVRFTEEALALADKANDTTTQSDIRELVAKEAANQRASLQELLTSLGISSLDGTESIAVESGTSTEILTVSNASDDDVSVVRIKTEDIKAYERTISKVGSVEVKALEQITTELHLESERPADLSLSIPFEPTRETTVGKEVGFTAVISSTGVHPIDRATVTVDWGDGRQSTKNVMNLAKESDDTVSFPHIYTVPGAFILRIVVSAPQGAAEWTTANNRESFAVTVLGLKPLCDIGARRCEDNQIVEMCVRSNGTTSWRRDRICLENELCFNGSCTAQCVSSCSSEGERRCNTAGTSTEVCERRGACLQWRTQALCSDRCVSGDCTSVVARCGDSRVSEFEQCDDGNTVSGDGCTASCRQEVQCTDDDGGNNPAKQGTVRGGGMNETDFCENPNTLLEFTCSAAGTPFANRLACPKGCRNGACIDQWICGNGILEPGESCDDSNRSRNDGCNDVCQIEKTCTDSDGGTNARIRGTVSLQGAQGTDTCIDSVSLREYQCVGSSGFTSTLVSCATACRDGACEPRPPSVCGNGTIEPPETCDDRNTMSGDGCSNICRVESVCTDSDGGMQPATKGFVKHGLSTFNDSCQNSLLLREYTCRNGYETSSVTYGCQYGCQNGACLSAPSAVCGNTVVETGEQCDDGNAVLGDGCSETCQTELDLSVSNIYYLRQRLTETTDSITVSVSVLNSGPPFSARGIVATLSAQGTDEYPSGFSWSGEMTTPTMGTNNGVNIHMAGQYIVPTNKAVNFPVTATARFSLPYTEAKPTNNTLSTSIVSDKAIDPCTDSDGGMTYEQKGTITSYVVGDSSYPAIDDICLKDSNNSSNVNPNMLSEGYCEAGIGKRQNYTCANGCTNGACLPSP